MPYKSKAQQRLFHYLESKGEMPKKTVKHFDEMTDFGDLPEHIKHAMGGYIDQLADTEQLEHPIDTSGEPAHGHRGDHYVEEEEHDAHGGMVHKYSKGGMVDKAHHAFSKHHHEVKHKEPHLKDGPMHGFEEPHHEEHYAHGGMAHHSEHGKHHAHGGKIHGKKGEFAKHLAKKMRGF